MRAISCTLVLIVVAFLGLGGCASLRPSAVALPATTSFPTAVALPTTASSPTAELGTHAVHWSTVAVELVAEDFYLEAGGKRYIANVPSVDLRSDPSTAHRTLEVTWQEHGVEMRLHLYFTSDATNWWAKEIRTYNGQQPGDWITYKGTFFKTPHGEPFVGDLDLTSMGQGDTPPIPGKLHLGNVRLELKPVPVVRPNEDGPVHVLQPWTGTTLISGQPFAVHARINVGYEVQSVTIWLWDSAVGFKQEWDIPAPANSGDFVLQQVLDVPQDAIPSQDYRLMVTAMPVLGASNSGATGYSLQVNVVQSP